MRISLPLFRRAAGMRHTHCSSRFDRSPESLAAGVRLWAEFSDVMTFTEVSRDTRAKALHLEGWGLAQVEDERHGEDECAVMYRMDKWRFVSAKSVRLSTHALTDRGPSKIYALHVVLEHKRTGQRVLVAVCHLPAHIDGGSGFRRDNPRDLSAFRDSVENWHLLLRANPTPHKVVVADFNIDFKRGWARGFVESAFPGLRLNWLGHMPGAAGTHGRRLIDGTLTNLRVIRARVLAHHRSSDHTPYTETLRFPRVRKRK